MNEETQQISFGKFLFTKFEDCGAAKISVSCRITGDYWYGFLEETFDLTQPEVEKLIAFLKCANKENQV